MKRKTPPPSREAFQTWLQANERCEIRIRYEKAQQPLPVGASKIGGAPDVPAGFEWPRFDASAEWLQGMLDRLRAVARFFHLAPQEKKKKEPLLLPMTFMAQFDLAEVSPFDSAGLLPRAGHLAFFYQNPVGNDDGRGCVFYFPQGTALQRTAQPEGVPEGELPEQRTTFAEEASFPTALRVPDELYDEDLYAEMCSFRDGEDTYKLLGWASEIQSPMEEECQMLAMGLDWKAFKNPQQKAAIEAGAADWMLLLQLGTIWENDGNEDVDVQNKKNKKCALMFGDSGAIYYWIRKQDLAAGNFAGVRLLWQCY